MAEFDAIVIGAGPAGEVCAGRLADGGLAVALVERELVGGECSYYACMPSKALLRPGEVLDEARRIPGAREAVADHGVDAQAALARRDEVIHGLDDAAQMPWLEKRDIALIRGSARLVGERRVVVGEQVLDARRAVVIATGSAAAMPPIPGLREADPWTNREATTATRVPSSLVVLGGGVVGVELAQAWATLGARVALIEGAERLIAREEPFASEQVAEGLRERGVDLRIGVKAVGVERSAAGVAVVLDDGDRVEGEQLLVAVGRRARTDDIGAEPFGVEPGKTIDVDDQLRVATTDWLYAIGDVNGRSQLTHAGKYQARVAADVILGRNARATSDGPRSPRVVFTDPQVAAVGLTLELAQDAGITAKAVDVPTGSTAGASFHGRDAPGTTRLVIDEDRRVVVGATFTGPETAEMLHAATIAVVAEVPLEKLREAIPSFPTRDEVWLKLLDAYGL